MEGVWIGSTLLSLHVGPLEIRRIEGLVQARCLWLQRELCIVEESTGLTDVTLYIYQCVHGLSPCLESHLHEARSLIISRYVPSTYSHACLGVSTQ